MKTYYDLKKKDRKEYVKEFKKTPVGKELVSNLMLLYFITGIFFFLEGFVTGYTSGAESTLSDSSLMLIDFLTYGTVMMFLVCAFYNFYIDINFTSWLKHKHDIKRW